jgi:hypothetical protein
MVDLVKPWIAFLKPWEEVKNIKGSIAEGIIYVEIGAFVFAVLSSLFQPVTFSRLSALVGTFIYSLNLNVFFIFF